MKLGTQTNSLTNHILSRAVKGQPKPVVGMGATILCWTDRQAATIINIQVTWAGDVLTVQEDHAKRIDNNGMSERQTWMFTRNPDGGRHHFRQVKTGMWQEVIWNTKTQRWNKVQGLGLRIGERDHYHDFSF